MQRSLVSVTVENTAYLVEANRAAARNGRLAWTVTRHTPRYYYDIVLDPQDGYVCNCSEYAAFAPYYRAYTCIHIHAVIATLIQAFHTHSAAMAPVEHTIVSTDDIYINTLDA